MLMTATELAPAAPSSSSPPSSYSPSSARELNSVGTAWGILAQVCVRAQAGEPLLLTKSLCC